jgi:hypothetical protein
MFCPFCGSELPNVEDLFQFCPFCGSELPNAANQPVQDVEAVFLGNKILCEELIARYFKQGIVYEKICSYITIMASICLRTPKAKLNSLGLQRRNNEVDMDILSARI